MRHHKTEVDGDDEGVQNNSMAPIENKIKTKRKKKN